MLKSTQQHLNFLIEINCNSFFHCFFSSMVYRNQFINLPHKSINWFLYGETVDRCEVYVILAVENYVLRAPS